MPASSPGDGEPPLASVLVGLVSAGDPIDHLLRALASQQGEVTHEVVVASRRGPAVAERLRREHPAVRLLEAAPGTTLPELRTRALAAARGRFILVTEDHTVPPPNWVASLVAALLRSPPRVAAAGGPVDNAMVERAVDWAAFLCEYSGYLPPLPPGETGDLAGMNVAYRRSELETVDRQELARGFWESTVHPRLLARGLTFLSLPELVIGHRKRFGFAFFMVQRYHYSRYFAGERFPPGERRRRLLYALLAPALPALVLARIVRRTAARPRYRRPLLSALPALACFALAWGAGELVGYLAGPGGSLAEIE